MNKLPQIKINKYFVSHKLYKFITETNQLGIVTRRIHHNFDIIIRYAKRINSTNSALETESSAAPTKKMRGRGKKPPEGSEVKRKIWTQDEITKMAEFVVQISGKIVVSGISAQLKHNIY